jgi:hypothetical protein
MEPRRQNARRYSPARSGTFRLEGETYAIIKDRTEQRARKVERSNTVVCAKMRWRTTRRVAACSAGRGAGALNLNLMMDGRAGCLDRAPFLDGAVCASAL